jgi:four helix bundle suffix protein
MMNMNRQNDTDGQYNTDRHGKTQTRNEGLIPKHGGYRKLKTFQLSELIYDVTARFCELFISPRSRTYDQMVQAGRSGRQNIAEGSVDSGTSKKMEMKLTCVAKGSQEELKLDFEDFLRQRGLPKWEPDHPALVRFKARRCASLDDFRAWVADETKRMASENTDRGNTDGRGRTQTRKSAASDGVSVGQCSSVSPRDFPAVCAANGALSLLNLSLYLLERQLAAQAKAFEKEGGFTERLYSVRSERRQTTQAIRRMSR